MIACLSGRGQRCERQAATNTPETVRLKPSTNAS
jgi:hypothetical protein